MGRQILGDERRGPARASELGMPPQVVTGNPTPTRRGLLRDESGATMVMGLFMAMLLVGGIYYMHGVARVILDRDRLQDAADASAFMAAASSARAMNILVTLNQLMEVLALVGMMSATARAAMLAGAITSGVECLASFICGFCLCDGDAIDNASDWWDYRSTDNRIQDMVDDGMSAIHSAAVVIRNAYPILAIAESVRIGTTDYRPQATFGLTLPARIPDFLPVEDDDSNWVCDEKIHWQGYSMTAAYLPFVASMNEGLWAGYLEVAIGSRGRAREYCEDDYFQRVEDDVWLGEEEFQLFSYVQGPTRYREAQRGVEASAFGRRGADNLSDALDFLNGRAIAQAEFYLEFRDDPRTFLQRLYFQPTANHREQWLWFPRWRARMRRVDFSQVPLLNRLPDNRIIDAISSIVAH